MLTHQDYRASVLRWYRLCREARMAPQAAYCYAKCMTKPLPEDRATQRVRTAAQHAQERARLYGAPMQAVFRTVYGNLRQDDY
jgi:hypothetical protein